MEETNFRILKLRCKNHYLFGDMEFDFTDANGNPVDTIIIAGENGAGKSTLLNLLFASSGGGFTPKDEGDYELVCKLNGKDFTFYRSVNSRGTAHYRVEPQINFELRSIFSDVAINYARNDIIRSITNRNVDESNDSRKSGENLAQYIEQSLIDIADLDANDLSEEYAERQKRKQSTDGIESHRRLKRFTNAFNYMFGSQLEWSRVDNNTSGKNVYFKNAQGIEVPLQNFSSGEKQIVFRGSYLLKDRNLLQGAIVLLDEPEISLHPEWQKKILNYYKKIFTNSTGFQTSQLFVVTHSPFIIHNENRYNDKIIVLTKDKDGSIKINDKSEYYSCNGTQVIEDAFNIQDFSYPMKNTVYVEGRTDEAYLKKCAEVYNLKLPFDIKWIGYIDDRGQERNTGKDALNQAFDFLVGNNNQFKTVLLYDSDANKSDYENNNVFIRSVPHYENERFKIGIENALIIDGIDFSGYYSVTSKTGNYGEKKDNQVFEKMKCCNGLCALDDNTLRNIFRNLKDLIDMIIKLLS